MTSYRPSAKTLPFVLLGLFGILYIYDAGLEQEKILPEIVSETISVPTQNTPGVQTRKIHIVQEGENLSVIFEKYNVSLNNTYKIFREDKTNEIKNILPNDRLEFLDLDGELQKIIIYKGPLLSYEVDLFPDISIERIDRKPDLISKTKSISHPKI